MQRDSSSTLLDHLREITILERSLSNALEEARPWLSSATSPHDSVRPLPTTMEQVHQVLAVARNLSARTSAPSGWNPQAPVAGFATPNPLPHQLRGGVLGTLQLERARESKRKQQENEEIKKRQKTDEEELANMQMSQEITKLEEKVEESQEARDPKRREVLQHEVQLDLKTNSDIRRSSQQIQPPKQQVLAADMNLSDSSSGDDSD
mmetsp:Transcript_6411/g.11680  ORF Transcript_6411/g.11680 Transcript_6411/m.11680 type:complete len:207 (-) Transcript_6411:1475-2095(-)|eukprot:CAMPEP_0202501644 /NCGR_PEP_ID=MMETSP1361-20130828/36844_1 /ASSEMBLY_ACC=CAM_ASM_000849 /TAXON_ID=210615 /ORGANISM="Staurosira complex sp., Strain CCMP2646" /LENGTH=206 /DNA_ID=CAMNT_0049134441 /DNA_START=166 /DNA_END=786 /DNA_ORIENTATION=+